MDRCAEGWKAALVLIPILLLLLLLLLGAPFQDGPPRRGVEGGRRTARRRGA